MGSECSSVGKAVCVPPTAPSFFSRKRKQKGISCRGSGWGEQPTGCQQLEEGPQHCSPWCCCLSWGLVGSPLGVWQAGGAASLVCHSLWLFREGAEGSALPGHCWPEQPSHQTFCSLPCARWRKCCILQIFLPPSLSSLPLLLVGIPES